MQDDPIRKNAPLSPEEEKAKATILAECDKLAQAGVTFVAVHFDGCGYSGVTEEVRCYHSEQYAWGDIDPVKYDALHLQDHFEALVYILSEGATVQNWLRLAHPHKVHARKSSDAEIQPIESSAAIRPAKDAAFRARITAATEWTDLELLFRTLTEVKAEPLILSMPIDAYAASGVSRSAREVYYERMRELAQRYHFPVVEFEQHDADPGFLIAHREHPTPRGWMAYNRALDDFFHESNGTNRELASPKH